MGFVTGFGMRGGEDKILLVDHGNSDSKHPFIFELTTLLNKRTVTHAPLQSLLANWTDSVEREFAVSCQHLRGLHQSSLT